MRAVVIRMSDELLNQIEKLALNNECNRSSMIRLLLIKSINDLPKDIGTISGGFSHKDTHEPDTRDSID